MEANDRSFKDKEHNKKSVVLVEYPRKGSWAVGFATKENTGEIKNKTNINLLMFLFQQLLTQQVVFY